MNWSGATSYCESLGSGWRLPTRAEALCICDNSGTLPPGSLPHNNPYWTSYTYMNIATVFVLSFDGSDLFDDGRENFYDVKCVK
jgi:hypothetical protein